MPRQADGNAMIIDCHGHYTTVPKKLHEWRRAQLAGEMPSADGPDISDDELRESIEGGQLKQQQERGGDVTLLSPIAGQMGHHLGTLADSIAWSRVCNDVIARVCAMFPRNFVGVGQLPQSPGAPIDACLDELTRCVEELGFVGCNLNPDVSGGHWNTLAMTDAYFFPLYERMVALRVPGMIHVSGSCNPSVHHTGAHYLNGDTTVFMQLIQTDLFKHFPDLNLIIPHGGGAVPYHWGRYRGFALEMGRNELEDDLLRNVYFDTCVYHQPGVDLLTSVIPTDNVLFGSEMIGAIKGKDPRTGFNFDDTKRYVDGATFLNDVDRAKIFSGNARRVYPRLDEKLTSLGL